MPHDRNASFFDQIRGEVDSVTASLMRIADFAQRGVEDEIKRLKEDMESARSDRALMATMFENASQKANQYMNVLASVLKSMQDMNSAIIRNIR